MADRAVHKAQISLDGVFADLLDLLAVADALNVRVCAEFEIDLVGIIDQLLRKCRADQIRQVAADLIGKTQFAVRERARAGKAGRDGAGGLAVDAFAGLRLRAMPLFHRFAFFNQQNLCFALIPQHFKRGEDTRRSRADDNQIEIHLFSPLLGCLQQAAPAHAFIIITCSAPQNKTPRKKADSIWNRLFEKPRSGQLISSRTAVRDGRL